MSSKACGIATCFVAGLALASAAKADELRVDGGVWLYHVAGFADVNGSRQNFESDLGVGAQRDGFVALEYAHGPSWLPDVAASYTRISGTGSSTTQASAGGIGIPGTTVTSTSSARFDDVDLSLRYEIPLGSFGLSPGLSVKSLTGRILTRDGATGQESRQSYDEVFPMLHARAVLALSPYLRFGAEGNWIAHDGDTAWDYSVSFEPRLLGPLGLYAGWQEKRYRVSTSGEELDARLRGMRLGVILAF